MTKETEKTIVRGDKAAKQESLSEEEFGFASTAALPRKAFTFQRSPRLSTNPRMEKKRRPLTHWNGPALLNNRHGTFAFLSLSNITTNNYLGFNSPI